MNEQRSKPRGETDNCRARLIKYCKGQGLDLGSGVTRIKTDAIAIDLYSQYADSNIDARILKHYKNDLFDYIFSSHLLEEIDDTEAVLREWLRVLKPGGNLVLYQADKDYYFPLGDPSCNRAHLHHFYWEELWEILQKIGGVELVHHNRCGPEIQEWSFELVVRKAGGKPQAVSGSSENKTISINMIYWEGDDPARLRNLDFTWKRLLNFSKFLSKKNLQITTKLYDFSEKKTAPFEDAIHISVPKGEYKKSWKINRVIEDNQNADVFSMFDSDVFFNESYYEKIYNMILNLNPDIYYTFNLVDTLNTDGVDFVTNSCVYEKMYIRNRHLSTMGGSYIINTQRLFDIGGFDERFIVWGGEDDDMSSRLNKLGLNRITSDFAPYHLPHSPSAMNEAYSQGSPHYMAQLHILKNDKTINRNFIKKK